MSELTQLSSLNNINQIILKNKIDENTEHNRIKIYIIKHILNNVFDNMLLNKIILYDDEQYIYGIYRTTKEKILKYILNNQIDKSELNKIVCCLFKSILQTLIVKKNENDTLIDQVNINKINKNTEILVKKQKKIVESLNEWNNKKLETIYKQSRQQTDIENEIYEQEFNKTNIGLQYHIIKQEYESQIQRKMSQISKRNDQIMNLQFNILTNRHNIENLQQEVLKTELEHKDKQAIQASLEQSNILQKQILNENISLRNNLNTSFTNIITVMKEQNDAIINSIQTTAESMRQTIEKSSIETEGTIQRMGENMKQSIDQQSDQIQKVLIDNATAQNNRLDQLNALITQNTAQQTALNNKVDSILRNISQLQSAIQFAQSASSGGSAQPSFSFGSTSSSTGSSPPGWGFWGVTHDFTTGITYHTSK